MGAERWALRDAFIVDGTGAPGFTGDLLVEGDRIAAVGRLGALDAIEIDAAGRTLCPGFVDVHSHADYSLLAFPTADSAARQGVTTAVVGNCGLGVAPCCHAYDVRRVALGVDEAWGVAIDWTDFGEYVAQIDRTAVNAAALVAHGPVRNAVAGLAPRPVTRAELTEMEALVEDAMAAGAAGLSTGLEYLPGAFADVDEISALAAIVARHDGMYATHVRNRGERFASAVEEALTVARRTGVRLQLSHVAPRPYAPAAEVERAFGLIESARAEGLTVEVDTFPEIWGPGTVADLLPREVMQASIPEVLAALRDGPTRRAIGEHFARADSFLVRAAGYGRIHLSANPHHEAWVGRSLPQLAEEQGTTLSELCCDLLLEAGERLMSVNIRHVYATEDALEDVIRLPYCSFGSDGVITAGEGNASPCPFSASAYGYTARVLQTYVHERGVLSLEDAVRRLSALPARMAGLDDRGVLRAGAVADLVLLDLDALDDRSRPDDPARHPAGFDAVFVAGTPVVRHGAPTDARPGRAVGRRLDSAVGA